MRAVLEASRLVENYSEALIVKREHVLKALLNQGLCKHVWDTWET